MPVVPPVPSVAWDDIAKQIGTGDLVLFSDNDGLGDLIEAVTGGPYSHTAHSGAQLGDARTVLRRMTGLGMTAYYRPMIWNRTPAFEQSVTDAMRNQ